MTTLAELRAQLEAAKAAEAAARDARLAVEEQILAALGPQLKDEGTVTVDGVRVLTGYTRNWDQAALHEASRRVAPEYWPFKAEWKEDRKRTREVEEREPDLWGVISPALTIKPKKPAVSLVGEKE